MQLNRQPASTGSFEQVAASGDFAVARHFGFVNTYIVAPDGRAGLSRTGGHELLVKDCECSEAAQVVRRFVASIVQSEPRSTFGGSCRHSDGVDTGNFASESVGGDKRRNEADECV